MKTRRSKRTPFIIILFLSSILLHSIPPVVHGALTDGSFNLPQNPPPPAIGPQGCSSGCNPNGAHKGPHTGVTLLSPGGSSAVGKDVLNDPDAYVLEGPSGTIVVASDFAEVQTPIKIAANNVPEGYRIEVSTKEVVTTKTKEILMKNLNQDEYEVTNVQLEGILPAGPTAVNIPMRVTIKTGVDKVSTVNTRIIEAINLSIDELIALLVREEPILIGSGISVGSFGFDDTVEFTMEPTASPVEIVEAPIRIGLGSIPTGYKLNTSLRTEVISKVREILANNLDSVKYRVRDASYEGILLSNTGTIVIPLRITVETTSRYSSQTYIELLAALELSRQELIDLLISRDVSLSDVRVEYGVYDFGSIIDFTPSPTPTNAVDLPLTVNMDDIAPGYIPSEKDEAAMLKILEEVLAKKMAEKGFDVEAVEMQNPAAAGRGRGRLLQEESQNSLYLPINVKVKGPDGMIDMAYEELLEVMEESKEEIAEKLAEYDAETFGGVSVTSEAGDVADVSSPTMITSHPIQFMFKQTKKGYELSERNRDSFIDHVKNVMKTKMSKESEMVQVAYARRFILDTDIPHLPVRVSVRGSKKTSEAEMLEYLLKFLRQQRQEFMVHLKGLDRNAFDGMVMSIESNDLPDVVVPTFVTEHYVWFGIKNTLGDATLFTKEMEAAVLVYMKNLISQEIGRFDPHLSLVDLVLAEGVEQASTYGKTISLPLSVTVRGPVEVSKETEQFVKQIVQEHDLDVKQFLQGLDAGMFSYSDSILVFETDDSVIEETVLAVREETEHPVMLIFRNVANDYRLSTANVEKISGYVNDLLYSNLGRHSCDLGRVRSRPDVFAPPVPFMVDVACSAETSSEALSHILGIIRENKNDLAVFTKALDWGSLKNVAIDVDTYDPASLITIPEVTLEESVHAVQLIFNGIPSSYRLSDANKASIIRFVKTLLDDELDDWLELLSVSSANSKANGPPLPLMIRVMGDRQRKHYAMVHIMNTLEEHSERLDLFIRGLDWGNMKDVTISVESYIPAAPAPAPAVELKQSRHRVQLNFDKVPATYKFSAPNEAQVTSFVQKLLDDHLHSSLETISVVKASRDVGRRLQQWGSLSLPLWVTVKGPASTFDYHLSYVLDALNEHHSDIESLVKSLDYNTFKDTAVLVDTWGVINDTNLEETAHAVKVNIKNTPARYRLTPEDRSSLIRFIKEMLEEKLASPFNFVSILDASRFDGYEFRTTHAYVPLWITVEGLATDSKLALSHVMDFLNSHTEEIEMFLESTDWDMYKDTQVEFDTFDFLTSTPPIVPNMEDTTHRVLLNLADVAPSSGSRLSPSEKSSIIRFLAELMGDKLMGGFQLIEIADRSRERKLLTSASALNQHRRLNAIDLPLEITVRGAGVHSDIALAYVMDTFVDHSSVIQDELRTLDYEKYENVKVSASTWEDVQETEHKLQYKFDNLPNGYQESETNQASIIRYIATLLENNLGGSYNSVSVTDLSRRIRKRQLRSLSATRRLDSNNLPINVAVNGPADQSDEAFSDVMSVLDDDENKESLKKFLQSINWDAYKDVVITVGPYDPFGMESEHSVQLIIKNVRDKYVPSQTILGSIRRFLTTLLEENLDDSHELIKLVYAGSKDKPNPRRSLSIGGEQDSRRLNSILALPLRITVVGPSNPASVLNHLMNILNDHENEITEYLRSLDKSSFPEGIEISALPYGDLSIKEENIHPVELIFEDTEPGTLLPSQDKNLLIQFVRERVEDSLDHAFDVMGLSPYASSVLGRVRGNRNLQDGSPSLPLLVRMQGPPDASDLGLVHLLEAIRENARDIANYLRTLDDVAFRDTRVAVRPYFGSSPPASVKEESDMPGWAWFLIVLAILLLLCCCCTCFSGYMYQKRMGEIETSRKIEVIEEAIVPPEYPVEVAPLPPRRLRRRQSRPSRRSTQYTAASVSTEDSDEKIFVIIPADASVAPSNVTFGIDPSAVVPYEDPSARTVSRRTSRSSRTTTQTSHSEELLALPAPYEEQLQLPPPHEEHLQLCGEGDLQAPSVHTVKTESVMPSQASMMEQDPSVHQLTSGRSQSQHYSSQASVDQDIVYHEEVLSQMPTHASVDPNYEVASAVTHSHHSYNYAGQEPRGVYYVEELQSQVDDHYRLESGTPVTDNIMYQDSESHIERQSVGIYSDASSYATQPPTSQQPHPYDIHQRGDAFLWKEDIPSVATSSQHQDMSMSSTRHSSVGPKRNRSSRKDKKHRKSMKKNRRLSGKVGVSSTSTGQQSADDFYLGHSATFYV